MIRFLALIGIQLASMHFCLCQDNDDIEEILEARKQGVIEFNNQSYTAHILTGKEYDPYYQWAVNSPFFRATDVSPGTLIYEGVKFNGIEIQYDLFLEKVVVFLESERHSSYATLDEEKISSFSFEGYDFIHVFHDQVMPDDIYQLGFAGKNSSLFIKRKKTRFERMKEGKIIVDFTPADLYYIKNKSGTFQVTSKMDLLLAYNKSSALINLIKEKKARFSKRRIEQNLIAILPFIDSQFTTD